MNKKSNIKKLHTKHSLQWYLSVGACFGSLNQHSAIKLSRVKPVIFQRWLQGKLAAPEAALTRIRQHAFRQPFNGRLKSAYRSGIQNDPPLAVYSEHLDAKNIEAVFLWKQMIFNELNMAGRRRVCSELSKLQRG